MKNAAIQLAARGFPVFPLRPETKIPRWKGWQDKATADAFWVLENWPADCSPGIATGKGFLVIDIEADGLEADLAALKLPPTLASRSARGGQHHFFKLPDGVSYGNSIKKIAPHTDVKATGGLVLGPGGTYRDPKTGMLGTAVWLDERPMALLPDHLIPVLNAAPVKAGNAGEWLVPPDTQIALTLARICMDEDLAQSILKGTRGSKTLEKANRLGDFGVSMEMARDMLRPWNARVCFPPQEDDQYELSVEHAYEYRQDPLGRDHPCRGFVEIASAPLPPPEEDDLLEDPDDITDEEILEADKNALVRGLIMPAENGMIYGDSGAGKTFVALDLAWHLARGMDWQGRRVPRRAPVLYINFESLAGFRGRLRAITKSKLSAGGWFARFKPRVSLAKGNDPKDYLGREGTDKIIAAGKRLEARTGRPVGLVVIDTLRRAMAGDDENSTQDITHFIEKRAKEIQEKLGAFVLIVHHTNKMGRAAGNNALWQTAELVLFVKYPENKPRSVLAEKVKDGEEGPMFDFRLAPVEIGTYKDQGVTVTKNSCVVERVEPVREVDEELLSALIPYIDDTGIPIARAIEKLHKHWDGAVAKASIEKRLMKAFVLGWAMAGGRQINKKDGLLRWATATH